MRANKKEQADIITAPSHSPIPEETARVARALFPKGNRYMHLRDEFGTVYSDEQFAGLYTQGGHFAVPRTW
ncbi:MAG: hypothetical protein ACJ8BW_08535 [Ktedonobacteraceae bacterium]